ncbi:hypothetical protein OXX59_003439 [Metschnikowia pulcherrima]
MTSPNFAPAASGQRHTHGHSHNLSINSVSSIAEPSTPPSVGFNSKSYFWDSHKMNGGLVLPSFSLGDLEGPGPDQTRKVSVDSSSSDKENRLAPYSFQVPKGKIDKEYLASLNRTPLTQLRGEILDLAKDQHGCRFLQKRLDESFVASSSSRHANFEIIFEQVKTSLYELIIDPFGNYLVQKLVDYFGEPDLDFCLRLLNSNMFSISINQHGTRALQKLIDKINTDLQFDLLQKGLKPYITEMIKDLNGNHVIQKVLNKYTPSDCQFIYDSIVVDLLVVATHKHGCCVLQKCLNHVTPVQHKVFADVILEHSNFSRLVNDQFGNYVLQYLISIDSMDVNYRLYENIQEYGLGSLCVLKFSSNVIEKLLMSCYKNEVKSTDFSTLKLTIISHILHGDLNSLINNAYGNYVVQTLIDILINPKAGYFIDLPTGERMLLPALRVLLDTNFQSSVDTLQVQIIKKWFQDCKIDSSFGKKIQCKINSVLNGSGKAYQKRSPRGSSSSLRFGSNFEPELFSASTLVPRRESNMMGYRSHSMNEDAKYGNPVNHQNRHTDNYSVYGDGDGYNTSQNLPVSNRRIYNNCSQSSGHLPRQVGTPLNLANHQATPASFQYRQPQALSVRHPTGYSALKHTGMEYHNTSNCAGYMAGDYNPHPVTADYILDQQYAMAYEQANRRVAHSSFFQRRQ